MGKVKTFDYMNKLQEAAKFEAAKSGYLNIWYGLKSCEISYRYLKPYNSNKYNGSAICFPECIENSKITLQLEKTAEYVFINIFLADYNKHGKTSELIGFFSWQLPDPDEIFNFYESIQRAAWFVESFVFDNFTKI